MNNQATYCYLPWKLLEVSGVDAPTFLQGQLTCDVVAINSSHSSLGAHCNVQGRVLATFYILAQTQGYLIGLPDSVADLLLKSLKKYALFSKVVLSDKSKDYQMVGFSNISVENLPSLAYETCSSDDLTFMRVPGEPIRYLAIGQTTAIERFIHGANSPWQEITNNDWELMDIRAGLPWINAQTQSLFTPHDIQYPTLGGVSFQKGCYTGQEIIARMEYRGKSKYGLYKVKVQSARPPLPGELFYADSASTQPIGTIISAALDAGENYELLGVILQTKIQEPIFWNGLNACK